MATSIIKGGEEFTLSNSSGWTFTKYICCKIGRIVYISGAYTTTSGTTNRNIQLADVIPDAYKPKVGSVDFAAYDNGTDNAMHGVINNRMISFYRSQTSNLTNIRFTAIYPI